MLLDKETKKAIKEMKEKIIWEAQKRKELLNAEIDYNFLQSLIDKSNNNPDLVITIYFKSGDKLVIQQKYQNDSYVSGYDGNPTVEEIK